jgi:hypothetical protein
VAIGFISSTYTPYQGGLTIVGWVYTDEKPIRKAEVLVWENGEVVSVHKSNRWGRFIIDLPLDRTFILSFSTPESVSKKLQFFTQVPTSSAKNDDFYFEFIVELFEPIPWMDKDFLENPLAIVFYDEPVYAFNYIKEDYEIMLAQLEIIKRNAAIYNMLGDDYKEKLKLAERLFYEGNHNRAFDLISEAADEIPENNLVKDIVEIVEQVIFDEQLAQNGETEFENISSILAINNNTRNNTGKKQAIEAPQLVIEPVCEQESQDTDKSFDHTLVSASESTTYETSDALIPLENPGIIIFTSAVPPFNVVEIPEKVMFMVQVLASPKKPGPGFFQKIQENMPDQKILHYKDLDQLDKYAVGVFFDLSQAMDTLRVLRKLNYDTYIIAFIDGKRVRVKEALALVNHPA